LQNESIKKKKIYRSKLRQKEFSGMVVEYLVNVMNYTFSELKYIN